ncbi:hypothetical protein MN116_000843 [Schistosoma mekongi]|uniref:Secreted protein n=1 Tax=Schistosoma mekongi TaxID=38744 RepID=A0AAE1ZK12_SCHME|nr:hypothetical protein MN116_000843 [Schistosoma mekongi]
MIYTKCLTIFSITTLLYTTIAQDYMWSDYQQPMIQNDERLTKRPWTLRDPLNCCLDNAKCCRRKRNFERKINGIDGNDDDEFGLTRGGDHAWKNRVYETNNRINPIIRKYTQERINK